MRTATHRLGLIALALGTFLSTAVGAEPTTINVWPGKAPGVADNAPEETWTKKRVTNVSHPTLAIYAPAADKNTGVAVIVCPGGGYKALMMDYEGTDVAEWLSSIGITGIVLKYRLPAAEGQPRYLPALQDAQRALSLVRSRASELHIDPARIGMGGFSAGAHLTCVVSTNFEHRSYEAIDAVDKVSCRPDFQIPIYTGALLEKDANGKNLNKLASLIAVTSQTPPAFLAIANDDKGGTESTVLYYLALKQAGVKADMHIYALGGHGFGIKADRKPATTWTDRCEEWMHSIGILPPLKEAEKPAAK